MLGWDEALVRRCTAVIRHCSTPQQSAVAQCACQSIQTLLRLVAQTRGPCRLGQHVAHEAEQLANVVVLRF